MALLGQVGLVCGRANGRPRKVTGCARDGKWTECKKKLGYTSSELLELAIHLAFGGEV